MPELKHNFTKSKMNKDLDERLVPNGEYRDAHNIEVLSSDGSDVGTVQTCMGNAMLSDLSPSQHWHNSMTPRYSSCVGSIADDKTNKIYYLVAGNEPITYNQTGADFYDLTVHHTHLILSGSNYISSDIIIEYDSVTNDTLPVMVDIYHVRTMLDGFVTGAMTTGTKVLQVIDTSGLRQGQNIVIRDYQGVEITYPGTFITSIQPAAKTIHLSNALMMLTQLQINNANFIVDISTPRALNFDKDKFVTGINIVDDNLYWIDGMRHGTEPKKVNITRGKQGTIPGYGVCRMCSANLNLENPYDSSPHGLTLNGGWLPTPAGTAHTELVVDGSVVNILDRSGILLGAPWGTSVYIEEKHLTVIRRGPLVPLQLEMYDRVNRFNTDPRTIRTTINTDTLNWWGNDPDDPQGPNILAPLGMTSNDWNSANPNSPLASFTDFSDWRVDDVILATDDVNAAYVNGLVTNAPLPFSGDDVRIKLKVISSNSTSLTPQYVQSPWWGNLHVEILYMDGTITNASTTWYFRLEGNIQPLYQLKFPKFSYRYKYEDGEYSAFAPFSELAFLPQEFDYHPKRGYNLGMINGMRQLFIKDFVAPNIPKDVFEIDILYKESDSPNIYTIKTLDKTEQEWVVPGTGAFKGLIEITNDMIHATVASNQLLRHWDNVPRKAVGQEVTGNRLIYGNYLQNYNMEYHEGGGALGTPFAFSLKPVLKAFVESNSISEVGFPEPSLKSMRTYQLGIAYKDFYGRETPVFTHHDGIVRIDPSKANKLNSITVEVLTQPPHWAHSFKYFVKEVSNEYYNLAMDRWYFAGDENIWLSFPSEDRNKVDDDTTLILKKTTLADTSATHGGFVPETPRYKILAIENEAPDFIKTSKVSMGKIDLETTAGQDNGTVIANGIFPYEGYDQVQIDKGKWEDSPFASLQNEKNQSGYLNSTANRNSSFMMRVVGISVGNMSDWYDISNITYVKKSTKHYQIQIDGIFKDDVLFATSLAGGSSNTATGIIKDLNIEIAKKTLENKAQFDGRFFVKIERDAHILKDIMGQATNYNAIGIQSGSLTEFSPMWRVVSADQLYFNAYNTDYNPNTDKYITTTGTQDVIDIRGASDWDDLIKRQSAVTYASVPSNSYHHGGGNIRGEYLYPRWFIDGEPTGNLNGCYNHPGMASHICTNHPGNGAQLGSRWMDIGWAGGYRYDSIYESPSIYPPDVGHAYPEQQKFIKKLETIGNRFRFTQDPDQIVYTITDWYTHDCFTTWDYMYVNSGPHGKWGKHQGVKKRWGLKLEPPIGTGATTVLTDVNGVNYTWQPTNPFTSIQLNNPTLATIIGAPNFMNTHINPSRADKNGLALGPTVQQPLAGQPSQGYSPPPGTPNVAGGADEVFPTGIEWVEPYYSSDNDMPQNPAIWETEPKEDIGLDIYYEVGKAYPVKMCDNTEELYIQPGAIVSMHTSDIGGTYTLSGWTDSNYYTDGALDAQVYPANTPTTITNYTNAYAPVPTQTFIDTGGWVPDHAMACQYGWDDGTNWVTEWIYVPSNNPNIVDDGTMQVTDATGIIPAGTLIIDSQMHNTWHLIIKLDTPIVIGPNAVNLNAPNPGPLTPVPCTYYAFQTPPNTPWWWDLTFTSNILITPESAITKTVVHDIQGCITIQDQNSQAPLPFPPAPIPLPSPLWPPLSGLPLATLVTLSIGQVLNAGDVLQFINPDGTIVTATVAFDSITNVTTGQISVYLNALAHGEKHTLPYYNCFSFGNGVESNRVRDLYNAVAIDKGARASTTLAEQYKQEERSTGLIFSGIYNSMNGINRLNQFIMAEGITKDLNPEYGSIQKLHTRDVDLVTLCEDKVVKILSHKDALYNADDTKNITATQNVLGNSIPFVGEYGISKNPESFASEAFRAYFTDKERGAVLRLSRDGLTPISDIGMKDWFADNLKSTLSPGGYHQQQKLLGSYDTRRSLYNLTLLTEDLMNWHDFTGYTVSFSENALGWVSFKSWDAETALSLNNEYYTGKNGWLWRHHDNSVDRNSFHSVDMSGGVGLDMPLDLVDGRINSRAYITLLFNDLPSIVKSFHTINYEGSQSRVWQNLQDPDKYYNNESSLGWYVREIVTDQQIGAIPGNIDNTLAAGEWQGEFINKEGKWFNYITGEETTWNNGPTWSNQQFLGGSGNLDTQNFTTQGLGSVEGYNFIP